LSTVDFDFGHYTRDGFEDCVLEAKAKASGQKQAQVYNQVRIFSVS